MFLLMLSAPILDTMIYDISQELRPGMPVWPGDTRFEARTTVPMGDPARGGSPVQIGALSLSTHTGTHADAPRHYAADGAHIGAVALDPYLGPCRVADVSRANGPVTPDQLADALHGVPPRLLIRTYRAVPLDRWDDDFRAIATATIEALAAAGGKLIGTDTPSLDPQTSKTMDAHQAVYRHGLAILEGLVLDAVPPGDYELIALPLRLTTADASPVRAILREL